MENDPITGLSEGALNLLRANTGIRGSPGAGTSGGLMTPGPPLGNDGGGIAGGEVPRILRTGTGGDLYNQRYQHYGLLDNFFASHPELSQYSSFLTNLPQWSDYLTWKGAQPPGSVPPHPPPIMPGNQPGPIRPGAPPPIGSVGGLQPLGGNTRSPFQILVPSRG